MRIEVLIVVLVLYIFINDLNEVLYKCDEIRVLYIYKIKFEYIII